MNNIRETRVKVFIPSKELVWITAELVTDSASNKRHVEITDDELKETRDSPRFYSIPSDNIEAYPLQNDYTDDEKGVDDMTKLNYLHEASILDNLRIRFQASSPYTYIGEICIAVNPYCWFPLYDEEKRKDYIFALRHQMRPHIYATSATAYRGLRDFERSQSVLVSGESGAGKTESVKILIGHIAYISGRKETSTHVQKVLDSNPLLETFGNAKTERNDNSSRFGKFTQLIFDKYCALAGSTCVTYLLEKNRVVKQTNLERNFHVFYQLLAAPEEVKASVCLNGLNPLNFEYTSMGDLNLGIIEGVTDREHFQRTERTLALFGVTDSTRVDLFRVLAGILYLGQLVFEGDQEQSSLTDAAADSVDVLSMCCSLLGVDRARFVLSLTCRTVSVEANDMSVPLSLTQAADCRDAVASDIYERVFNWLVDSINRSTAPIDLDASQLNPQTISLLDIFGFESFDVNRFEQLCINFANEKLQKKFTEDVFYGVQKEYQDEGLEWRLISYKDNAEILELFEGRGGIISTLNEECLVPKGNDLNYHGRLVASCAKHPHFGYAQHLPKIRRNEFVVNHYAGSVTYCVEGFVERNRDTLPPDVIQVLASSKNTLLKDIAYSSTSAIASTRPRMTSSPSSFSDRDFAVAWGTPASVLSPSLSATDFRSPASLSTPSETSGGPGSAPKITPARGVRRQQSFLKSDTVAIKFRNQLASLVMEIRQTNVQYVRCIKPNSIKNPAIFDRKMVCSQLQYAGMIEAVRISRAAYPYKMTFTDFLSRFGKLRSKILKRSDETDGSKVRAMLDSFIIQREGADIDSRNVRLNFKIGKVAISQTVLGENNHSNNGVVVGAGATGASAKSFEVGMTRVYFSVGVLEALERLRSDIWGVYLISIQSLYRCVALRRKFLKKKRAAIVMQQAMRRAFHWRRFVQIRAAIVKLQQGFRRGAAIRALRLKKRQPQEPPSQSLLTAAKETMRRARQAMRSVRNQLLGLFKGQEDVITTTTMGAGGAVVSPGGSASAVKKKQKTILSRFKQYFSKLFASTQQRDSVAAIMHPSSVLSTTAAPNIHPASNNSEMLRERANTNPSDVSDVSDGNESSYVTWRNSDGDIDNPQATAALTPNVTFGTAAAAAALALKEFTTNPNSPKSSIHTTPQSALDPNYTDVDMVFRITPQRIESLTPHAEIGDSGGKRSSENTTSGAGNKDSSPSVSPFGISPSNVVVTPMTGDVAPLPPVPLVSNIGDNHHNSSWRDCEEEDSLSPFGLSPSGVVITPVPVPAPEPRPSPSKSAPKLPPPAAAIAAAAAVSIKFSTPQSLAASSSVLDAIYGEPYDTDANKVSGVQLQSYSALSPSLNVGLSPSLVSSALDHSAKGATTGESSPTSNFLLRTHITPSADKVTSTDAAKNAALSPLLSGVVESSYSSVADNLVTDAVPIEAEDMMSIIASLEAEDDNDEKLKLIKVRKTPYLFESSQLLMMLDTTPSVKTRLEIVLMLSPRLTDPLARKDEIVASFRYAEHKTQAEAALKARMLLLNSAAFASGANGTSDVPDESAGAAASSVSASQQPSDGSETDSRQSRRQSLVRASSSILAQKKSSVVSRRISLEAKKAPTDSL